MISPTPFPPEIVLHILLELDLSNILATRLTCKQFHGATKTHHFWLTHARRLQAKTGYVLPYTGSFYTAEELEQWVSRRQQILDNIWSRSSPVRMEIRSFESYPEALKHSDFYEFLPGGRFLLSYGRISGLLLIDVESTPPSLPFSFDPWSIPGQDDTDLHFFTYSYWTDYSTRCISFLFAVTHSRATTHSRGRILKTRIFSLISEDTSNPSAKLISRPHATFTDKVAEHGHNWELGVWISAFNNRYFVKVECLFSISQMTVLDYSTAIEKHDFPEKGSRPLLINSNSIKALKFIHDSILILVHSIGLRIYEITEPAAIEHPPIIQELHALDLDYALDHISPARWFPAFSRITLYDLNNLPHFLKIPHDKSTPSIRRAATGSLDLRWKNLGLQPGCFWSLLYTHDGTPEALHALDLVKYPWDGTGLVRHLQVGAREKNTMSAVVAFSEEVGRLLMIFWHGNSHTFKIFDIV
ncbi:hypothetical protein D9756_005037 [Leucocoprinus leucothites]|uniref:F-box domain-containing protein n=1 Tax=Leucocoprinus leucothites TaxID=201217 RepID=A0A8H5G9Y3_9AGAR|nr:hypothetical protein D9756_005037 [Leucoagaricus leucothites]